MQIHLIEKESLSSTNDTLAELLRMVPDMEEGTVVRAIEQTAGKGQIGNHWESEAKKNITISLLLRPDFLSIVDHFYISIAVSLGITDYLQSKDVEDVRIKWPNDIYVGKNKICGVLIENSIIGHIIDSSIIGIGININQEKFISNAPNPISLTNITGHTYDIKDEIRQLCNALLRRYAMLANGNQEVLREEYIARMYRYNEMAEYKLPSTDTIFKAKITDVAPEGRLIMESDSGKVMKFAFKEVVFC
ncbi:MAG: biotin--[acetyl-CoA-carboxylase] ligase [Paludibacteraceae bacterium]|nr:biotin--[acetyl-CoA-carboxylase] ligase [Paludibacteraceae bacterium]